MNDAQMSGGTQPEFTPEMALKYLNDASSEVQGSRKEHAMIQKALTVLNLTIQQWRAMQAQAPSDGPPDAPGGPEDPDKLITEG